MIRHADARKLLRGLLTFGVLVSIFVSIPVCGQGGRYGHCATDIDLGRLPLAAGYRQRDRAQSQFRPH